MTSSTRLLAAIAVAALALPAAAAARPSAGDHPGNGNGGPPDLSGVAPDHPGQGGHPGANDHPGAENSPGSEHQGGGGGQGPKVAYVFKGTVNDDGTVAVDRGNNHVRRGGLVGVDVEFDLSSTKLTVADTNADGATDVTDVLSGDRVVVMAKLPKNEPGDAPFEARRLVDQTNPPVDDEGGEATS